MKRSNVGFLDSFRYIDNNINAKRAKKYIETFENWYKYFTENDVLFDELSNLFVLGFKAETSLHIEIEKFAKSMPEHIIVVQVGNFYNCYGNHAAILMKFAGLNRKGRSFEAGFPTECFEKFTRKLITNNFKLAIFSQNVSKSSGKIERKLSNILSTANPYLMNNVNLNTIDQITAKCVVILFNSKIITLNIQCAVIGSIVNMEKKSIITTLDTKNPNEVIVCDTEDYKFFTNKSNSKKFINEIDFVFLKDCFDEDDAVKKTFARHFVQTYTKKDNNENNFQRISLTANLIEELGLDSNAISIENQENNLPSLMKQMLPSCPTIVKQIFKKWLIINVDENERKQMSQLFSDIHNAKISCKKSEILTSCSVFLGILKTNDGLLNNPNVFKYLMNIVLPVAESDENNLSLRNCAKTLLGFDKIESTKDEAFNADIFTKIKDMKITSENSSFLQGKTDVVQSFVGDQLKNTLLNFTYKSELEKQTEELESSVLELQNMYNTNNNNVIIVNGTIMLKMNKSDEKNYRNATQENGKNYFNSSTTERIEIASEEIKTIFHKQKSFEAKLLKEMSHKLIIDKISLNKILIVITEFLLKHCVYNIMSCVLPKKWTLSPVERAETSAAVSAKGLFPFWMKREEDRVDNDVEIKAFDVTMLTAPNTNGKSTFLRTLMANCILYNAGFPTSSKFFTTNINFSNFIIKFPGKDRPNKKLSSFASEIVDLKNILDTSTKNTIICFDEFARGTSNLEALAVCTALIETMRERKSTVIFSTHIFTLLDKFKSCEKLTITKNFQIEKGSTRTSDAVKVLKKHDIDKNFVKRVELILLQKDVDDVVVEVLVDDVVVDDVVDDDDENVSNFQKVFNICKTNAVTEKIDVFDADVMLPTKVLNSKAVLYFIEETNGEVYIGETNNIIRRRIEHLNRCQFRNGKIGIIAMTDKSSSLQNESKLIRICLAQNIGISSKTDGNHI
jgi:DNA mismatch repair ATPase MutS